MSKPKTEGAPPNRTDKRRTLKDEVARAKRSISDTKPGIDLKTMPSWMKIAGIAIVFSFCGGAFLLEVIANGSLSNSQAAFLLVSIVVLGVAAYGWWSSKLRMSSETGNKVSHSHSQGAHPMERVHGKWRMEAPNTTPGLLAPTTAVQRKERQPSKKYQIVPRTAITSPVEMGHLASNQAHGPQPQMTLDSAKS